MPGNEPVQALTRGLDILLSLARNGEGMRLNELSAELGLNASTACNLVKTMRLKGFVEKGADGRLKIGSALKELVNGDAAERRQAKIASAMQELAAELAESVATYSEISGSEAAVALRISPDMPGKIQRPQARSFSLYFNISALVLLAFADEESASWLKLNHPFAEEAAPRWKDEKELDCFLKRLKADGFGRAPFDEPGAIRMAAPILGKDDTLIGCLGVSSKPLEGESAKTAERRVSAALLAASRKIAEQLKGS